MNEPKKAAGETEKQAYIRPSWDEYFMKIADLVGTRGSCDRGRNGCVITRNRRIIATGYVGSPVGLPHCDEVGHEMHTVTHADGTTSRHCIRTAHAEQNAICEAARMGIALEGSTLYVKMASCYTCAKMIINAGIKRVVCAQDYHASRTDVLRQAGVEVVLLDEKIMPYEDQ